MHYLTFGSVVTVSNLKDEFLLMIVDWNCLDSQGNSWDYAAVPETLGWTFIEDTEKKENQFVNLLLFNHEDIEKIFFVGPPNEGNIELEQQAFNDAIKNELPIAKYYSEHNASELEVSFDDSKDLSSYIKTSENSNSKPYFPIGTICTIDVGNSETGINLQNAMIVAVKPYYLVDEYEVDSGKDYRVMLWDTGYFSIDEPICINNDDIAAIVSMGYVNADVQNILQSNIVTDDSIWSLVKEDK